MWRRFFNHIAVLKVTSRIVFVVIIVSGLVNSFHLSAQSHNCDSFDREAYADSLLEKHAEAFEICLDSAARCYRLLIEVSKKPDTQEGDSVGLSILASVMAKNPDFFKALENKSRETAINLLSTYETENDEQQILLLEKSNKLKESRLRMQWLVIISLLLLGLLVVLSGWSIIRDKNRKLKLMKSELHHFLWHEKGKDGGQQGLISLQEHFSGKWGLTPRESEILYQLEQGCSNAQIAKKLFISENTVKFHIKNIYIKLNVKSRMEAVLRCSES